MGAKQSKRSVDISGKEAEGGGDVATSGGAGRVEPLADADSLKPHLNGDAHIQTPDEEKEKKLENGTPEADKDATTEKEKEAAPESEKEVESPVTNGETEHKEGENGESTAATPEQESGKKPKKEKVKKKWSLRSISFSRKDKPKQEKKVKEEETKTNGETEKLPEEVVEQPAEATEVKVSESAPESEQKTPETPVTEPLTNGSAPETPKIVTPVEEEPEKPSVVDELPLNGLSIQEEKEEVKVEVPNSEPAETPEIPVKSEVCVETTPTAPSSPPPLPISPPPSSVATFAVTTMATDTLPPALATTLTESNEPEVPRDPSPVKLIPEPTKELTPEPEPSVIADEAIAVSTEVVQKIEDPVKDEIEVPIKEEIEAPIKEEIESPIKEEIEAPVKEITDSPIKEEIPPTKEEILETTPKEIETPVSEEIKPVDKIDEPVDLPKPVDVSIDEESIKVDEPMSIEDVDILDLPPPEPMMETESSSPVTDNVTSDNAKSDDEIIDNGVIDNNGLAEEDLAKDFQGNELDDITEKTKKLVMTNGEYNGNPEEDLPPPPQDLVAEKISEIVAPEVTSDAPPPSSDTVSEATSEVAQ